MVIHIEAKRTYGKRWNVRFGDIEGSTDIYNTTKSELIKSIESEIEEEDKKYFPSGKLKPVKLAKPKQR